MIKNIAVVVIAALLGAYVTSGFFTQAEAKSDTEAAAPAGAPQAMPISVASALQKEITAFREYSGRLKAAEDVQIRPRVGGQIETVHFKEGDLVKKGDLLFTLDLRPYKAVVSQAKAAVTAAEARASLATKEAQRAEALFGGKAYSQRELDEKKNASLEAAANIQATKAQLEIANLNLEYAEIRSPIDGRVGRPDITVGNIVDAGGSAPVLTTIQSVDPIFADFDMDEGAYLTALKEIRAEGRAQEMPVFMALADEREFTREGKIRSFDNQLVGTSGTLRVRAEFTNTDGLLTPGLFARIRLGEADKTNAVLINDTAIGTDQDRRFVYVVGEDGAAAYRPVTLGALEGSMRVITSGLQAGEKIIVNGLQRVRPGAHVQPMIVSMETLKPEGAPAEGQPPAEALPQE